MTCNDGASSRRALTASRISSSCATRLLFEALVHGVGKSTNCKKICADLKLNYLSASKIINWAKINDDKKSKEVNNINDNQDLLIRGLRNILKKDLTYLLDGHFCLLNKKRDICKSSVEHSIKGMRCDVAFITKKEKIAVEIETGKNNALQTSNKVVWLNKNFDKWIILCSRDNKKKYNKYADNKKSFCLTVKETHDKINTLIK